MYARFLHEPVNGGHGFSEETVFRFNYLFISPFLLNYIYQRLYLFYALVSLKCATGILLLDTVYLTFDCSLFFNNISQTEQKTIPFLLLNCYDKQFYGIIKYRNVCLHVSSVYLMASHKEHGFFAWHSFIIYASEATFIVNQPIGFTCQSTIILESRLDVVAKVCLIAMDM